MLERYPASVNSRRWSGVVLLLMLVLTAPRTLACPLNEGELLIAYEVIAPLVAYYGPVLALRVDREGCVEVQRSVLSRSPGRKRKMLSRDELASLKAELQNIPSDLHPAAAQQALRTLDRDRREGFAVADAPIRRFHFARDGRAPLVFVWRNLEQDVLNHGDEPEVRLIAAWRDRLEAITRLIEEEAAP